MRTDSRNNPTKELFPKRRLTKSPDNGGAAAHVKTFEFTDVEMRNYAANLNHGGGVRWLARLNVAGNLNERVWMLSSHRIRSFARLPTFFLFHWFPATFVILTLHDDIILSGPREMGWYGTKKKKKWEKWELWRRTWEGKCMNRTQENQKNRLNEKNERGFEKKNRSGWWERGLMALILHDSSIDTLKENGVEGRRVEGGFSFFTFRAGNHPYIFPKNVALEYASNMATWTVWRHTWKHRLSYGKNLELKTQ